jgi:signal recognition particle subunit SRP54
MLKNTDLSKQEKEFKRMEGMVCSMTPHERRNPQVLNAKRRQRIAKGSGVTVAELNTMLNKFAQMQQMMKKMGKFQKMAARMGGGGMGGLLRKKSFLAPLLPAPPDCFRTRPVTAVLSSAAR